MELKAIASLQQQMEVMPAIEPEPCTLGLALKSTACYKKIILKNPFLL